MGGWQNGLIYFKGNLNLVLMVTVDSENTAEIECETEVFPIATGCPWDRICIPMRWVPLRVD